MTALATMEGYCDKNGQQSSEEELYFEMDFQRREEREERGGSSVGPILGRPKYLRNFLNNLNYLRILNG